jgi:hypothetical protein
MKRIFFAGLFFLGIGIVWAQNSAVSDPKPNLAEKEVVEIATQKAKTEKIDIATYDMTECHYEYIRKNHTWTVLFTQKPPTPPGGHFLVWVDDETKKATLMWGE